MIVEFIPKANHFFSDCILVSKYKSKRIIVVKEENDNIVWDTMYKLVHNKIHESIIPVIILDTLHYGTVRDIIIQRDWM